MPLKLMYITNSEDIARIAEDSGVDIIFIDLEINGKNRRQGHLDTVISQHGMEDVKKVKRVLSKAELLVRINPVYDGTKSEIDRAISYGADIIMLPFFTSKNEVEDFIHFTNGRVKTCLLCETPGAVQNIDDILAPDGIDYVHIGLNDLHLGYHMKFMFELITDGTVEMLCEKFKKRGIPYGIGGIAKLGQGDLPAEYVIAEHYRLGSGMAILSRSFCNAKETGDICEIEGIFEAEVGKIRKYERSLMCRDEQFFTDNLALIKEKVDAIVRNKAN